MVSVLQDATETALNSSIDVLFAAAAYHADTPHVDKVAGARTPPVLASSAAAFAPSGHPSACLCP